ncbi:MAG: DHHA1 domain-containing protein [Clostridia bacterium]
MKDISIFEAVAFLKENDNFLLFTHASPDGDTLGSALALQLLLEKSQKTALILCPDEIPDRLKFLPRSDKIIHSIPEGKFTLVSIDIASLPMLRGLDEIFLSTLIFDLSIDHHCTNTVPCAQRLLFANYSAAGEIIAEMVPEFGYDFDQALAFCLYASISSDSGCFKYSSTRPKTHMIAAELLKTGIDFAKINRLLFETKTVSQLALEREAYNCIELFFDGKVAIACLKEELFQNGDILESDVDGVNQIPRQILGVEVSAVIRKKNSEIKVSLRSNDYFDVSLLASSFGGGGHMHAAGCRFNTSIADAKAKILYALESEFDGNKRDS